MANFEVFRAIFSGIIFGTGLSVELTGVDTPHTPFVSEHPIGKEETNRDPTVVVGSAGWIDHGGFRKILDPLNQLAPYLREHVTYAEFRPELGAPWKRVPLELHARVPEDSVPIDFDRIKGQPLLGMRVVLDPGHRGGAWSSTERRHVRAGPGPAVREGDLTYRVAVELRSILGRLGAHVILTRGSPPKRDFPRDVFPGFAAEEEARQWLLELIGLPEFDPVRPLAVREMSGWIQPWLVRGLAASHPFRLYNRYELRERARSASGFDPHVTLSLHFNVARDRLTNGVIVFMLGNFLRGELSTRSQRYYAMRYLFSGDVARARTVGQTLGLAMREEFELPVLREPALVSGRPRKKIPVVPESGVFARNLAILRRTPGIVLLIEGPCMNALGEFARLQNQPSVRVRSYVRAVTRALVTQAPFIMTTHRQKK